MMAALRKILGVRRIDKIRNEDIRVKTGCVKTVQIVYERQHKWLGHALRIKNNRIARNTRQNWRKQEKRKPRKTWTRACEERSELSLHQASQLAQDRTRWREFGQIVRAHVRPSRHKRLATDKAQKKKKEEVFCNAYVVCNEYVKLTRTLK